MSRATNNVVSFNLLYFNKISEPQSYNFKSFENEFRIHWVIAHVFIQEHEEHHEKPLSLSEGKSSKVVIDEKPSLDKSKNPHEQAEPQGSVEPEVEVLIPSVSLVDKMAIFYGVPVTKFVVHLISYVSFLIIFSMYFLFYRPTDGKGNTGQRIYEWALATIWFSYYVDMVQNLVTLDASWAMKLRLWLQSEWSVLDFCYLHLALASFALNGVFPDYVKGYVKVKSDQGPQIIDIY